MLKKAGNETAQICRCLSLAPSTFYYRIKHRACKLMNTRLEIAIKSIHNEMDGIYGKRRMLVELVKKGFKLGLDKVRRLMRKLGLVAKRPKQHSYPRGGKSSLLAPNHLNRQFNPATINRYWSGDITYIRTRQGWLYLAVVMDLCSRRIVGWAFSEKPNSLLTVKALNMAIQRRKGKCPTLFHCDQGIQYRSEQFQQLLSYHQITFSMSRAGNCLDNAVTERFFRSLKSERINYRDYITREQAMVDIIDYIEPIYNQKRRHYKLGFISPAEFEHNLLKTA
ncbi:IS3 family transposase [Orbus mooreae]|uniref:IS3 family transposase n=1 Tax=Orbus mooreae TaxID=3074107 RepID=UPI00370D2EDB